ncbi:hypothetical protein [Halobacteriaceae bacterium SHR40]|uniref:hypothetical protein n=1 Tax=Halovenus amylolytica TaxID=2500550 RepID=UPI000FE2D8E8
MSTTQTIAGRYQQYRDEIWLSVYTLLILFSGYVIGGVISRAFGSYSGLQESLRNVIEFIPLFDFVAFVSVIIGVYLGLLTLLFLDFKKRIQTLLLGFGTLFSFLIIWSEGIMFTVMGPVDYVIILLVGLFVTFTVGGATLRRLTVNPDNTFRVRSWFTTDGDEPVEFPQAARYLKLILAVFVFISVFEAYTQYNTFIVPSEEFLKIQTSAMESFEAGGSESAVARDILFSTLFVGAFWQFLDYEAGKRIVFIGPPRSGKTHLILGLYTAAQNANYNPRGVSKFITDQKEYIINNREWAEATEEQTHKMGFSYTSQDIFSKNIHIDGLDYPGEYSYYIPDGLALMKDGMALPDTPIDNPIEKLPPGMDLADVGEQFASIDSADPQWNFLVANAENGFERQYKDLIDEIERQRDSRRGGGGDRNAAYLHLVCSVLPRVRDADTLGFMFDMSQYKNWETDGGGRYLEVEYYQRIIDEANANQSIGIATKSDTLKGEFVEDRRIEPADNYDEFQNYVNEHLLNSPYRGAIQSLQIKPVPIYIHNESDRPEVPVRTFGIEPLLTKFGE